MILFVVGIVIGFYLGYMTNHEIKLSTKYDLHIECGSEEERNRIVEKLKNKDGDS